MRLNGAGVAQNQQHQDAFSTLSSSLGNVSSFSSSNQALSHASSHSSIPAIDQDVQDGSDDEDEEDDDDAPGSRQCAWGDCSMEFPTMAELVAHVKMHIGGGKATYVCEWRGCSRGLRPFVKRHKMQNHARTHTKERPFLCTHEDCGKSFSRQDGLSTHLKTHSDVKPFVCSFPNCHKAY
ncbi:hypothetical protein BC831DRAFT_395752, partial [Entophlyctis helioformis]